MQVPGGQKKLLTGSMEVIYLTILERRFVTHDGPMGRTVYLPTNLPSKLTKYM